MTFAIQECRTHLQHTAHEKVPTRCYVWPPSIVRIPVTLNLMIREAAAWMPLPDALRRFDTKPANLLYSQYIRAKCSLASFIVMVLCDRLPHGPATTIYAQCMITASCKPCTRTVISAKLYRPCWNGMSRSFEACVVQPWRQLYGGASFQLLLLRRREIVRMIILSRGRRSFGLSIPEG